jgi:hypothetical protein
MPAAKRDALLAAAQAFCNSFANKEAPAKILSHFSTSDDVVALEHGLPQLAPFLGRHFRGRAGLESYFHLLSSHLKYENMRFSNFVVDAEVSKVSVRGEATFTWISTAQSWDEIFTYVLEFDQENRVLVYEVWAGEYRYRACNVCPQNSYANDRSDSGAAYLASKAQLCQ